MLCFLLKFSNMILIGNLPPESICHVCETYCGAEKHLCDFKCSWCQWTVHEKCLPNMADLCTLGTFRNFIIPPNCIKLQVNQRVRLQSQCNVLSIQDPQFGSQWKPLIVIGIESFKIHILFLIFVLICYWDLFASEVCRFPSGINCSIWNSYDLFYRAFV